MPRAIVCRELGEPEALRFETISRGRPTHSDEIRIIVRACGINFPDILMVAGRYQHKPPVPFIPGMEAAGEVAEVGNEVQEFAVGDKVIVKQKDGAFTEELVAKAVDAIRLPKSYDYAQGATFLAAHSTAYHSIVERAAIRPGETLLVHGATGGVGLAAIEIGKVFGANVIAIASSEEKLAIARKQGADHGLLSGQPFREEVKELTNGRGADVVFDPVGGNSFEESLRCMNWGARICVVGFLSGVGVAQTNLVLIKGASILGIRAGEVVRRNPEIRLQRHAALIQLAEEGRITPHISHRVPLEHCAEGMRVLIDRKAIGRVALLT